MEKTDSELNEIRIQHEFYEKIKKRRHSLDCDEMEFFERVRKYNCVECAIDRAHDFLHDCEVPNKQMIKWITEQESIYYEPSSPMYSKESFEGLNLKTMVLDTLIAKRHNKPTKVQGEALPAILADPPRDVIFQGASGTGKTIALILAMLSRIDETKNCTQILCLVPTLLSAEKVSMEVARWLMVVAKFHATLTGGEIYTENDWPSENVIAYVAVGTAESMLDWVKNSSIDMDNISALMIDDVDYLMKSQECWSDCKKLIKLLPSTCQMVFCSTTLNQSSIGMASEVMKTPDLIMTSPIPQCLKTVKQYYIRSNSKEDKFHEIRKLYNCLTDDRVKVIIFCNENETAMWLYKMWEADGTFVTQNINFPRASIVTTDVKYEPDNPSYMRLTYGNGPFCEYCDFLYGRGARVLITTDILSRMEIRFDIKSLHIVNFDLPVNQFGEADFETYLHRIGRGGRFDEEAIAINLIDSEKSMGVCRTIEEYFGKEIHPLNADAPNEVELKLCPNE